MENKTIENKILDYKIDSWKSVLSFMGFLFVSFSVIASFLFFMFGTLLNSIENSINRVDRKAIELPMYNSKLKIKKIFDSDISQEEKEKKIREEVNNVDSLENESQTLNNYTDDLETNKKETYDNAINITFYFIAIFLVILIVLALLIVLRLMYLSSEAIKYIK